MTILANGIIEANHPNLGKIQIGRIDLVTFDNPYGLEGVGNSYFKQTGNSGRLAPGMSFIMGTAPVAIMTAFP